MVQKMAVQAVNRVPDAECFEVPDYANPANFDGYCPCIDEHDAYGVDTLIITQFTYGFVKGDAVDKPGLLVDRIVTASKMVDKAALQIG